MPRRSIFGYQNGTPKAEKMRAPRFEAQKVDGLRDLVAGQT
jgi:hypothetical protein